MDRMAPVIYQIKVRETLNISTAKLLGDVTVEELQTGETLLTGAFIDQPALRGFINQLWNLNLTLVSVEMAERRDERNGNFDLSKEN